MFMHVCVCVVFTEYCEEIAEAVLVSTFQLYPRCIISITGPASSAPAPALSTRAPPDPDSDP